MYSCIIFSLAGHDLHKNPDKKAALSRTSRQTSFKMFQFKAAVKEEYPHTMATTFEAVKI